MSKLRFGLAGLAALGLSALATGGANAQGFSFTADFGSGYAAYDEGYGSGYRTGYRTVREDTYIRRHDRGYGHDGWGGRHDEYGYGHRPRRGYGHGYGHGYGYGRPVGFAPHHDRECIVRVKKYFDGYSWVKEKRRTCR
jgi:hypothetical protein